MYTLACTPRSRDQVSRFQGARISPFAHSMFRKVETNSKRFSDLKTLKMAVVPGELFELHVRVVEARNLRKVIVSRDFRTCE